MIVTLPPPSDVEVADRRQFLTALGVAGLLAGCGRRAEPAPPATPTVSVADVTEAAYAGRCARNILPSGRNHLEVPRRLLDGRRSWP